jgi:NAD(P)-dependent dehydrogenase (short-subunit alcohol dehydrogenase family)
MADILVVGGAGGVGFEVVRKLAERGETVVTTVLNQAEASRVANLLGSKVTIHEIDLGDADAALVQLRGIVESMKCLSGVAICAAISRNGPMELAPLAEFRKMLEVNCIADIAVYQAAMPALRKSKGTMVMISSVSGKIGLPLVGGYTTSKFALEGAADVMRREAAEQGVKISVIAPGGIRTTMIPDQIEADKKRLAALTEESRQRYGHLFERFKVVAGGSVETASTPSDIADIVLSALDAPNPEPRYAGGSDAQQMLDMQKSMSDRQFDEVVAKMFSKSASSGWADDGIAGPG